MSVSYGLVQSLDRIDFRLFQETYCRGADNIEAQIAAYLGNIGFRKHHIQKALRENLISNLTASGANPEGQQVFDRYGRLSARFIRDRPYSDLYPAPIDECDFETLCVESDNEWYDPTFPDGLSFVCRQKFRAPLRLYQADQTSIFADASGFQVYNRDFSRFYPTGSPFCYTNSILPRRELDVQIVVIIADFFDGGNFCHFLFDWLGRIAMLHASPKPVDQQAIYLAGGVPLEIHDLLVAETCRLFKLSPDQFMFPTHPVVLKVQKEAYWFSNAVEHNQHPGHLMHPHVVDFINALARKLGMPASASAPPTPKIYISRGDAGSRRIDNEARILDMLAPLGFRSVQLSKLSAQDQIALTSSASEIVAPHGMGLTHLAFSNQHPRVIELFHPKIGTDGYTVLARSKHCRYDYLVGEDVGGTNFSIDLASLAAMI